MPGAPFKSHLLKPAMKNWLTYSKDFAGADWIPSEASLTTEQISPSCVAEGYGVVGSVNNTAHGFLHTSITPTVSEPFVLSVWARAGNRSWCRLQAHTDTYAYFDLASGTVGTATNCTAHVDPYTYHNNYYRVYIRFIGTGTALIPGIFAALEDSDDTYIGDAISSDIYIYGALVNEGLNPGSLTDTDGIDFTRDAESLIYVGDDGNTDTTGGSLSIDVLTPYGPPSGENEFFSVNDGTGDNELSFSLQPTTGQVSLRVSHPNFGATLNSVTNVCDGSSHSVKTFYEVGEEIGLYVDNILEDTYDSGPTFLTDQDPLATLSVGIALIPGGDDVFVYWGDGDVDTITANGVEQTVSHNYSTIDEYCIRIAGDVEGIYILNLTGSPVLGDVSTLAAFTSLQQLYISNTAFSGDVSSLATLTNLTRFYASNTLLSGDVSSLGTLVNLDRLYLANTSIAGDVGGLSTLTSLNRLYLYETSVTGDVAGLDTLTSLVLLYIDNTSIAGDVGGLSTLTSLSQLLIGDTNITGDIGDLATLTFLTKLLVFNTDVYGDLGDLAPLTLMFELFVNNTDIGYTTTTLPTWSSPVIQFEDCELTTTEVDAFIIDLATAGGTNGTLTIGGTNAPRSTVSDAAVLTLTGNGWTVSANGPETTFSTDQSTLTTLTARITVDTGNDVSIYWGDGSSDVVVADGTQKIMSHNYSVTDQYPVYIGGDVDGITILNMSNMAIYGDVVGFEDFTSLTELWLYNTSVSGDVSALSAMTSLESLWLYNTSVSGDVGALSTLTSLIRLYLYSTSITGDVGDLSTLTSIVRLYLYDTAVAGDIADLSNLTTLTHLYLFSTSVSGDVGELSTLTSMEQLLLYDTSISGDVGELNTLTALTFLYLYSTSIGYTTATLPAWSNTDIRLQESLLTTQEVDDFIIDLADAGGSNGTLSIAGSNESRSAASDSALMDLTDNGWTVTVNEPTETFSTDQSTLTTLDVKITVDTGNEVFIFWGDDSFDTVVADGTEKTVSHTYSSTGQYDVRIGGEIAGVTFINISGQPVLGDVGGFAELISLETIFANNSAITGDVGDLSTLTSLTQLLLPNTSVTGDVGDLSTLTSLTTLYLYDTSVTGDVGDLSTLTSLAQLFIYNTSVTGDVGDLSTLTTLTWLYAYNTSISGDVGDLSTLTSLERILLGGTSVTGDVGDLDTLTSLDWLYMQSTSVSGDVGDLSTLTSLERILLNDTSVSGDVGDLSPMTSLAFLYLYDTSVGYNTTTLPTWSSNDIRLQDCAFTTTEVDDFLIDLAAAGGSNGTLNIAGTNAIRSSASDTALTTLTGDGWSVTVNE